LSGCLPRFDVYRAAGLTSTNNTVPSNPKAMSAPAVSLGYVILFVKNVAKSVEFYEHAFGVARRFFNDDNGKAYAELDTGAARVAFCSLELVKSQLRGDVVLAAPDKPPLGFEIALLTADVPALYARAVKAGAVPVSEPATKPWGQTVAYVHDCDGHIVELCTPLP
jgi:lactoylglutathione lyase